MRLNSIFLCLGIVACCTGIASAGSHLGFAHHSFWEKFSSGGAIAAFEKNLNPPGNPEYSEVKHNTCFAGNSGSFKVTATPSMGSTMSFALTGTLYTGASFSQSIITENPTDGMREFSGLKAGKYKVKLTDASGSTTISNIIIKHPPQAMSPTKTTPVPVTCMGGSNGKVTIKQPFKAATGAYQDNSLIGSVTFTLTSGPGTLPPAVVDDSSPYSANFTNLPAGDYVCTILASGCGTTSTVDFTIDAPTAVTATSTSTTDNLCFGDKLGKIRVQAGEGNGGPYKFQIGTNPAVLGNNAAGTDSHEFTGLAAGTYSITVYDSKGCSATMTEIVKEPTLLVAGMPTSTPVSCYNGQNGTATFSATGGTPPYVFNLGGATFTEYESATFTQLSAGVKTCTITDANGCKTTATVTIEQPTAIKPSAMVTNVKCNGGMDGAIKLTIGGGTPDYTYKWSDDVMAISKDRAGLKAGTYVVTVTDANLCTAVQTVTVNEPAKLAVKHLVKPVSCSDNPNGSIDLTPSGGVLPYTYLWADGATSKDRTGLEPGDYSATVTDGNGCTFETGIITLYKPLPPTLSNLAPKNAPCHDGKGSASVEVCGAGGPYKVIVCDENGEQVGDAVTVSGECQPTPQLPATINPPMSPIAIFTELAPGSYTIKATGENGCTAYSDQFTIKAREFGLSLTTVDAKCNGMASGSASIEVCGENGPYSVVLCDEDGLPMGSATELSGDCLGGSGEEVTNFGEGTSGLFSLSGSASFSEAFPPAFYPNIVILASTGETGEGSVIFTVPAGHSSVTIFDALLVLYDQDEGDHVGPNIYVDEAYYGYLMTVDEMTKRFETKIKMLDPSVPHVIELRYPSNKAIYFAVKAQKTGASTSSLTKDNLAAGNYKFKVTYGDGCESMQPFTIGQPSKLVATAQVTDVKCADKENGSIELAVSGGTPGYSYDWADLNSDPQFKEEEPQDRDGLAKGLYFVTVTDANGCTVALPAANGELKVDGPELLYSEALVTQPGCGEGHEGGIDLNPMGGKAPYSFDWGGGISSEDRTGLQPGEYSVIVTDANSCQAIFGFELYEPKPGEIGIPMTSDVKCPGGSDGAVTVDVCGEDGPYSVVVCDEDGKPVGDPLETSGDCGGGEPGAPLNVPEMNDNNPENGEIDAYGFVQQDPSVLFFTGLYCNEEPNTIASPSPIYISMDVPAGFESVVFRGKILHNLGDDLSRPIYIIGNTGQFEVDYFITGSAGGNEDYINSSTFEQTIEVNPLGGQHIELYFNFPPDPELCFEYSTGIYAEPATNGGNSGSLTFTGLSAGNYTIKATGKNGCESTQTFTITEPEGLSYTLQANPVTCNGDEDGSITLQICDEDLEKDYSVQLCQVITDGDEKTTLDLPGEYVLSGDCSTGGGEGKTVRTFTDAATTEAAIELDGDFSYQTTYDPMDFYAYPEGEAAILTLQVPHGYSSVTFGGYLQRYVDDDATLQVKFNGIYFEGFSSVTPDDSEFSFHYFVKTFTVDPDGGDIIELSVPASGFSYNFLYFAISATTIPSDPGDGSSLTIDDLAPGEYAFKVTGDNNCTKTIPFTIGEPAPVSADTSYLPISCNGGTTTVTLTGKGGNNDGVYTFKKGSNEPVLDIVDPQDDGYSTNNVFTGLGAGEHTFYVKDANGCEGQVTVNIAEPKELVATATAKLTGECNSNTWLVTVAAEGGTGKYTGIGDFEANDPGTYTYPVTDEFGCLAEAEITLTPPPALEVFEKITNVSCNGLSDGKIGLSVLGGTPFLDVNNKPFYTYEWSGEGTVADADSQTGLAAGTYTVTVTDSRGCVVVIDDPAIDITQPDKLFVAIEQTPILCHGGCSEVTITTITGGTAPYQYDEMDCLPANAEPYLFTISDANGCELTTEINITEPPKFKANAEATTICFGELSIATVTAMGGTKPYEFTNLDTEESNETGIFSDLGAGEHNFSVKDGNGCEAMASVTVAEPVEFSLTAEIVNGECDSEGTISIEVIGGEPEFSYFWGNADGPLEGENESTIKPESGDYWVTVTDGNGCKQSLGPLTIFQATPITATATATPTDCSGGQNGSIHILAKGGDQVFTYSIDGGDTYQNSPDFLNLAKGNYEVVVKDGAGCKVELDASVDEPTPISATVETTPAGCGNSSNGSFTLSAIGGTTDMEEGYLYSKNDGGSYQTSPTFSGLEAGIYFVKIRDKNDCTFSMKVEIKTATAPTALAKAGEIACFGGSTTIFASGDGGKSPYKFALDGSAQQLDGMFSNVKAGPHSVVVTDANGCTAISTLMISQPTELDAQTTNIVSVTCAGSMDGSITVSATGGTPDYSFQLNGGAAQTSGTFGTLAPGDYSIVVKDKNGCSKTVSATVKQAASPVKLATSFFNAKCFGTATGSITAMASAGSAPYEYRLGTGSFGTTNTFENLAAGEYLIEAKDAKGCTATILTTIGQPADALSVSTDVSQVTCNGSSDGSITVNASGGTAGYLYKLGNGDYQADNIFQNVAPGAYVIVVKDANGCVKGVSVNISEPAALKIAATPTNASCDTNDGKIEATATGGNGGYEYSLNMGDYQSSGLFTGLAPGDHTVTVKDSKGCTASISVTITGMTGGPLKIVLDEVAMVSCANSNNGAIKTTVTGCGPFTFLWSKAGTTGIVGSSEDLVNIPPGTYSLFVIDGAGMSASLSDIVVGSVPVSIQNLAVVHNTSCEVKISWSAVSNIAGYEVRFQPCNGGTVWTTINVGTATEFTFTGLNPLTCYNFCVRYKGETCDGQWTCLASTVTAEFNPPVNLSSVVKSNTSALIKWAQSLCPGQNPANVEFRYRKITSPVTTTWSVGLLVDTAKQHLLKNLTPGVCYEYRLRNRFVVSGVAKWSGLTPIKSFCLPLSLTDDNGLMMIETGADFTQNEAKAASGLQLDERSDNGFEISANMLEFTLAPNPASDFVNVHFNAVGTDKSLTIRLLDLSGRLVSSQSGIELTDIFDYQLAVETLPQGIYLIEVSDGMSRQIGKFVKQ